MTKEEFIESIKKLGIEIDNTKINQLEVYLNYLLEYNSHTNLTAIKNPSDIYLKHFYDSLTIAKVIDLKNETNLLDIGSGAGFPGMVLKIFFPNLHIVLVDSNNKKTKFLTELKDKLHVDNLEVINQRIEDITPKYLNSFDIVTARAVTNMAVLTELAMPLVKENKYFIAMKGNNTEELENGKYAIKAMHGIIMEINSFELPNNAGARNIVKIKKNAATDIKTLRSYEKIIKKPLIK